VKDRAPRPQPAPVRAMKYPPPVTFARELRRSAREHASQLRLAGRVASGAATVDVVARAIAEDLAELGGGCLHPVHHRGRSLRCDRCEGCTLLDLAERAELALKVNRAAARSVGAVARIARCRKPPKGERPCCGARTRTGAPCRARVLVAEGHAGRELVARRCKLHGGASTGPRTAEGRRRSLEALARGREVLRSRGGCAPHGGADVDPRGLEGPARA
jgi:hypothetical protein